MFTSAKRLGFIALMGLLWLDLARPAAHAQLANIYDPYGLNRAAAFNIGLYGRAMSHVPPYALGFNPYMRGLGASPYALGLAGGFGALGGLGGALGGYGGYGYGGYGLYNVNPYGGFLRGSAQLVTSQGQFLKNQQEANLKREEVRQARLKTRRQALDEWLYERANTPTLQDERERTQKMELRRALTDPPPTEIWSGDALNRILDHLTKLKPQMTPPDILLDPDMLKKINVTDGTTRGNVGLLKNGGKLDWPSVLRGRDFESERDDINKLLPYAIRFIEQNNGRVDLSTWKQLKSDVEKMHARLAEQIADLSLTDYIEAKRYLTLVGGAVQALDNARIGGYLSGKLAASGRTIEELVNNMKKNGLSFAPAAPGEEAAYQALHRALVQYDLQVSKE